MKHHPLKSFRKRRGEQIEIILYMTNQKPWYQSKTIVGGIALAVIFLLERFAGFNIADDGKDSLGAIITALGETVALILVFWGRISADKKIVIRKPELIEDEKPDYR